MIPGIIAYAETINFRKLEEGELIELVKGTNPVVFEGIDEMTYPKKINIVCLDPVDGLCRRTYNLTEGCHIEDVTSVVTEYLDHDSQEGKGYLAMINGANGGES